MAVKQPNATVPVSSVVEWIGLARYTNSKVPYDEGGKDTVLRLSARINLPSFENLIQVIG